MHTFASFVWDDPAHQEVVKNEEWKAISKALAEKHYANGTLLRQEHYAEWDQAFSEFLKLHSQPACLISVEVEVPDV